jgi:hypothetical protein
MPKFTGMLHHRAVKVSEAGSKLIVTILILAVALVACALPGAPRAQPTAAPPVSVAEGEIALPAPRLKGEVSLEEALRLRRSVRAYTNVPLTLAEISQLFWVAQGLAHEHNLSGKRGRRCCLLRGEFHNP